MNFFNNPIGSLVGAMKGAAQDPNSMFGRMAQSFGMADPAVGTPAGMTNPDAFHKELSKFDPNPAGQAASAEQERMAQNNGFKNYDQMLLWAKQRNMQSGGTVGAPARAPSVQQGVNAVQSAHPAGVFNRITEVLKNALGGN